MDGLDGMSRDAIGKMTQEDRKAAMESYRAIKSETVDSRTDELYVRLSDDVHAHGVKDFVPGGYSIAQALAARASRLATLGMIIYDGDGSSTCEQWKALVTETYRDLLQAAICKPELLWGGGKDGESDYESKHGQHFMSCSMLGEPDWCDCYIDYSEYGVEENDPHGLLHELSLNRFYVEQDEIRVNQYLAWGNCDETTGNGMAASPNKIGELYESTELGRFRAEASRHKEEQLDAETYRDVHAAGGTTIVKSMVACEKAMGADMDGNPGVRECKSALDEVYRHLTWFFGYYADARERAGLSPR